MTRTRKKVLLAAAACHLALVVAGGLHLCLWDAGLPGRLATYYGALSGVDTGYAFFAPRVAIPPRARFTITDRAGREFADVLTTGVTREADIRIEDLIEVFTKTSKRRRDREAVRELQREIARSWAAAMFTRHPEAVSVVVDVGRPRVPSMAKLRRGEPPGWRSLYRVRVTRAAERPAGASS
ncbi:MAG TPA: hypothetical protein VIK91_20435 [Nannocystis sp.]